MFHHLSRRYLQLFQTCRTIFGDNGNEKLKRTETRFSEVYDSGAGGLNEEEHMVIPTRDYFQYIGNQSQRKLVEVHLQRFIVEFRMDRYVSTGGGAVIRPINWKYMHQGISIWLDVPLEALAHRIAAVGNNSWPLLHDDSGDAYTVAFKRLSTIWDECGEAYTNANARISLESLILLQKARGFRYSYLEGSSYFAGIWL